MAPGWERRDVKVWNFRLWRLQWTMGLQEHRQGILFGRLSGCPGLQSQSPLWLWALVCPLGSPTTGQPLVRWKEEVRTLVRQPGRDPCGGERSMGRRHSVHPGVSRGVQPLLHSHLQQHVSTEGRQTCSNSQQGKLQFCQWSLIIDNKNFLVYIYIGLLLFLRISWRFHRTQGRQRSILGPNRIQSCAQDPIRKCNQRRTLLLGGLSAAGQLCRGLQCQICLRKARYVSYIVSVNNLPRDHMYIVANMGPSSVSSLNNPICYLTISLLMS